LRGKKRCHLEKGNSAAKPRMRAIEGRGERVACELTDEGALGKGIR